MDFSFVLVLPFAALVALTTMIGAVLAKRSMPRLIWPFAFSTIFAALALLRLPDAEALGYWIIAFILLAFWAAFGTLVGAMAARALIAATNFLRTR